MTRDLTLALTGIAALCVLTGCNLMPGENNAQPQPSPTTTTASTTEAAPSPTASPESTAPLPTPTPGTTATIDVYPSNPCATPPVIPEQELARLRNALYIDDWSRSISVEFEVNGLSIRGTGEPLEPGLLQETIEKDMRNQTPFGFETFVETDVNNNFTIGVWHPDGYLYTTRETAYLARSKFITATDRPTDPQQMSLAPLSCYDYVTAETVYRVAIEAGTYQSQNGNEPPTEDYIRETGLIGIGYEFSMTHSPVYSNMWLIRVWHPKGQLFNSEKNAAYRDTFTKDQLRPASNFNFSGFLPSVRQDLPKEYEGSPTPTPTPGSTEGAAPTPTPTPTAIHTQG